jgi:hypothetical protein
MVHERQKILSKPAFQQSLMVLVIVTFYEVVQFAVDGWAGHPAASPLCCIHCGDRLAVLGARRCHRHPRHGTSLVSGTRFLGREI